MLFITMQIKKISKSGKYCNLLFNSEDLLKLRQEVYLKYQLNKNTEYAQDYLDKLSQESEDYDIRDKAFDLISRQKHSAFELKRKLLQRKFSNNKVNEVISDLANKGYINDMDYAVYYSAQLNSKGKGALEISHKLKSKGVANNIVADVIKKYVNPDIEYKQAECFALRKLKTINTTRYTKAKIKEKVIRSLLGKGFSYEITENVANMLLK